MMGSIGLREMQYLIGGLILMVLVVAVVLTGIDPLKSPTYRALELAQVTAGYINALSIEKDVKGDVKIERDGEFDVSVIFYDERNFAIEYPRRLYQYISSGATFGREGYYVVVTPYRRGEQLESKTAFLAGYPMSKNENLEVVLSKTSDVCISKEAGDLAKVAAC